MSTPKAGLAELLEQQGPLVIDGALATELEARGHDLSHPLWSGKTLKEKPEAIKQVHLDYFLAGADIAITASYQTTTQGLKDHFQLDEDEAKDLIRLSVRLAQEAKNEAAKHGVDNILNLLVAGSVGPYGAYLANGSEYTGDYDLSTAQYENFHRPRIQALVEAGVDLLAIETMPNSLEIRAIRDLLQVEFPSTVAWYSCTLKDATHLADGSPLFDLSSAFYGYERQVLAVGFNCVQPEIALEALEHMRTLTTLPLLCYPNSGETYKAEQHSWSGDRSTEQMRDLALRYRAEGAQLVGGCCRTTPKDIKSIADGLQDD